MGNWYPEDIFRDYPQLKALKTKRENKNPFDSLPTTDWSLLDDAHSHQKSDRRLFNAVIKSFGEFVETELRFEDLCQVYFVDYYWQFFHGPKRVTEFRDILNLTVATDLRKQLKTLEGQAFAQEENVIIVPARSINAQPQPLFLNILIEGTFRVCWFQQQNAGKKLRCWIPKGYW